MHMMTRTNYYFPDSMMKELKAMSEDSGVPVSELIRRAIAVYLDETALRYKQAGPAGVSNFISASEALARAWR